MPAAPTAVVGVIDGDPEPRLGCLELSVRLLDDDVGAASTSSPAPARRGRPNGGDQNGLAFCIDEDQRGRVLVRWRGGADGFDQDSAAHGQDAVGSNVRRSEQTWQVSSAFLPRESDSEVFASLGMEAVDWLWQGYSALVLSVGLDGDGVAASIGEACAAGAKSVALLFGHGVHSKGEGFADAAAGTGVKGGGSSVSRPSGLITRCFEEICRRAKSDPDPERYCFGLSVWELAGSDTEDLFAAPGEDASRELRFETVRFQCAEDATALLEAAGVIDGRSSRHVFVRVVLFDSQRESLAALHFAQVASSCCCNSDAIGKDRQALWALLEAAATGEPLDAIVSSGLGGGVSRLSEVLGPLVAGNCKPFLLCSVPERPHTVEEAKEAQSLLDLSERASLITAQCHCVQGVRREDFQLADFAVVLRRVRVRFRVRSLASLGGKAHGREPLPELAAETLAGGGAFAEVKVVNGESRHGGEACLAPTGIDAEEPRIPQNRSRSPSEDGAAESRCTDEALRKSPDSPEWPGPCARRGRLSRDKAWAAAAVAATQGSNGDDASQSSFAPPPRRAPSAVTAVTTAVATPTTQSQPAVDSVVDDVAGIMAGVQGTETTLHDHGSAAVEARAAQEACLEECRELSAACTALKARNEAKAARRSRELREAQAEVAAMREELDRYEDACESPELLQMFRSEANNLRAEVARLREENAALSGARGPERRKAVQRTALQALQEEAKELRKVACEVEQGEKRANLVHRCLEEVSSRLNAAKRRLVDTEREQTLLQPACAQLGAQIEQAERERRCVQEELDKLRRTSGGLRAEVSKLREVRSAIDALPQEQSPHMDAGAVDAANTSRGGAERFAALQRRLPTVAPQLMPLAARARSEMEELEQCCQRLEDRRRRLEKVVPHAEAVNCSEYGFGDGASLAGGSSVASGATSGATGSRRRARSSESSVGGLTSNVGALGRSDSQERVYSVTRNVSGQSLMSGGSLGGGGGGCGSARSARSTPRWNGCGLGTVGGTGAPCSTLGKERQSQALVAHSGANGSTNPTLGGNTACGPAPALLQTDAPMPHSATSRGPSARAVAATPRGSARASSQQVTPRPGTWAQAGREPPSRGRHAPRPPAAQRSSSRGPVGGATAVATGRAGSVEASAVVGSGGLFSRGGANARVPSEESFVRTSVTGNGCLGNTGTFGLRGAAGVLNDLGLRVPLGRHTTVDGVQWQQERPRSSSRRSRSADRTSGFSERTASPVRMGPGSSSAVAASVASNARRAQAGKGASSGYATYPAGVGVPLGGLSQRFGGTFAAPLDGTQGTPLLNSGGQKL